MYSWPSRRPIGPAQIDGHTTVTDCSRVVARLAPMARESRLDTPNSSSLDRIPCTPPACRSTNCSPSARSAGSAAAAQAGSTATRWRRPSSSPTIRPAIAAEANERRSQQSRTASVATPSTPGPPGRRAPQRGRPTVRANCGGAAHAGRSSVSVNEAARRLPRLARRGARPGRGRGLGRIGRRGRGPGRLPHPDSSNSSGSSARGAGSASTGREHTAG